VLVFANKEGAVVCCVDPPLVPVSYCVTVAAALAYNIEGFDWAPPPKRPPDWAVPCGCWAWVVEAPKSPPLEAPGVEILGGPKSPPLLWGWLVVWFAAFPLSAISTGAYRNKCYVDTYKSPPPPAAPVLMLNELDRPKPAMLSNSCLWNGSLCMHVKKDGEETRLRFATELTMQPRCRGLVFSHAILS
jgi:hypothetical protein